MVSCGSSNMALCMDGGGGWGRLADEGTIISDLAAAGGPVSCGLGRKREPTDVLARKNTLKPWKLEQGARSHGKGNGWPWPPQEPIRCGCGVKNKQGERFVDDGELNQQSLSARS